MRAAMLVLLKDLKKVWLKNWFVYIWLATYVMLKVFEVRSNARKKPSLYFTTWDFRCIGIFLPPPWSSPSTQTHSDIIGPRLPWRDNAFSHLAMATCILDSWSQDPCPRSNQRRQLTPCISRLQETKVLSHREAGTSDCQWLCVTVSELWD